MGQVSRLEVHVDALGRASSVLDGAGRALFGSAARMDVSVDAGSSSGEVASAMTALSTAVAALAEQLGSLAASTQAAASDFSQTDQVVAGGMGGLRAELGR